LNIIGHWRETPLVHRKLKFAAFFTLACSTISVALAQHSEDLGGRNGIRHVLLISIDGMHALDFLNCTQGLSGVNSGQPYCPHLAQLAQHGVNYLAATTSKPSDSFPGLMAIVSGGSPRTVGAFYDVAYDRSLDGPALATGNGNAPSGCTAGTQPTGYTTEFDEGIDIDQSKLNGGAPAGTDGGIQSIDPRKLDRDPAHGCAPVYPWNFVRTNTIFGAIHAAGGYTAWSDKHPSYSAVAGPSHNANTLDDYYSPEINSNVIALPGVTTPTGVSCASVRDTLQTGSWTDSFENIQCYDTLKVNAILNQIQGRRHDGKAKAPVPAIFGMNFQAVSVGQKLIEYNDANGTIVATGGYQDAFGTPTASLLSEIQFADASIGAFVDEIRQQGLQDSTLILITAKHGQSPIDPNRVTKIGSPNTPADIVASLLPTSEIDPNGIGPTQDDVSLLWLKDSGQTATAVSMLQSHAAAAGIGEIFAGRGIAQMYNAAPADPRTPDIVIAPQVGVIYTGSKRKLEEHGGFAHDDTNVMLLVSNPSLPAATITSPVETMQVAPTILTVLGLNPNSLQAVQKEGTQALPGIPFTAGHSGDN
jgi:hypothetical protein